MVGLSLTVPANSDATLIASVQPGLPCSVLIAITVRWAPPASATGPQSWSGTPFGGPAVGLSLRFCFPFESTALDVEGAELDDSAEFEVAEAAALVEVSCAELSDVSFVPHPVDTASAARAAVANTSWVAFTEKSPDLEARPSNPARSHQSSGLATG